MYKRENKHSNADSEHCGTKDNDEAHKIWGQQRDNERSLERPTKWEQASESAGAPRARHPAWALTERFAT